MRELISAEEIRVLADSAMEILTRRKSDWAEDERERRSLWINTAREALRFCARAAEMLEDASLIPILVNAIHALAPYDDDFYTQDNIPVVAQGLKELLSHAPRLSAEARALVRHERSEIRAAMAKGLQPVREEEIALLEELSSDPVVEVRNAAKESLASLREIPWWRGKFSQDPLLHLGPEEAIALKPTLEEIAQLLNHSSYEQSKQAGRLVDLAGLLPDVLLKDLAKNCLSDYESVLRGALDPLGVLLLSRPGGDEILFALLARWSRTEGGSLHGGAVAARIMSGLPPNDRVLLCHKLLAKICAAYPEERRRETHNPYGLASDAVMRAWPPGESLSPLLDAILSLSEGEGEGMDLTRLRLCGVFVRDDIDLSPLAGRLLEAFFSGCPGPWKNIGGWLQMILARLPKEALRPAAERALESREDKLVVWGLLQLVGSLHDPGRDPSPPLLIQGFFEQPHYHRFFYEHFYDLGLRALPLLRAELRTKSLHFREAAWVMLAIDRVYGGLTDTIFDRDKEEKEKRSAEEREKLAALLGPEEWRGSPTEEEWRVYRAIRDVHPFPRAPYEERDDWYEALRVFPEGPWHPEDRAFLERAIALLRAGDADLGLSCARALGANPTPEDLPLLDEIIAISAVDESLLRKQKKRALRKLGLSPHEAGAHRERGWMDEEDEDE